MERREDRRKRRQRLVSKNIHDLYGPAEELFKNKPVMRTNS